MGENSKKKQDIVFLSGNPVVAIDVALINCINSAIKNSGRGPVLICFLSRGIFRAT